MLHWLFTTLFVLLVPLVTTKVTHEAAMTKKVYRQRVYWPECL